MMLRMMRRRMTRRMRALRIRVQEERCRLGGELGVQVGAEQVATRGDGVRMMIMMMTPLGGKRMIMMIMMMTMMMMMMMMMMMGVRWGGTRCRAGIGWTG
jgi:hypothetical protein